MVAVHYNNGWKYKQQDHACHEGEHDDCPKADQTTKKTGWTQQRADGCLALISMAWGASYLLMKAGLDGIGPFNLIGLRFGIAFLVTALIFHRRLRKITLPVIGYGAIMGLMLFDCLSSLCTV